ncbi:MAG: hypothetical protein MJH10_03785 [Epibacterium sp.]|nr:hypothetical protein [Epibacterium sp.]
MINYARDHSVADSLRYQAVWQTGMFQIQDDMTKVFKAKSEGREPEFSEICEIRPTIE